jgi:hypothetical protein
MRLANVALVVFGLTSVLVAEHVHAIEPTSILQTEVATDVYTFAALYGEDAFAVNVAGDWQTNEALRIRLDAGFVDSEDNAADGTDGITTYTGRLTFDYHFDPVGLSVGYEYWGDTDSIDTQAALAAVYFRNDTTYFAAKGERRRIVLSYDIPPAARNLFDDRQTIHSNGYGVAASQRFDWLILRADAMQYDYDVPLDEVSTRADLSRVPPPFRAAVLQRLDRIVERASAIKSASMSQAVLDSSIGAGVEIAFGDRALVIDAVREQFAFDGAKLNTVSLGWIAPLKSVGDFETRVSSSHATEFGTSLYFGFTLWIYR